ncbi:unnamed protein product [Mytilus edulis]|uniref:Uncharacterized protein n=1 Tax=Mytilus edulis TaxID=6550 RepID=A0A8S3SKK0_MYTED|nr:unnamed protein product [Mytilus edulis]
MYCLLWQSKETLEKYKTDIIKSLTKKLHDYLTSHDGKEEILNPHGSKPISKISYISLQQEVQSRFNNGLQRWGTGQEAALIMKPAEDYLKSEIKDVESKLHEIEISMTGKEEAGDFTKTDGAIIVLAILTLPITLVLSVAICLVFLPISVPFLLVGHFAGFDYRQSLIDETYNNCLFSVSMASLKKKFEASFGDEFDKVIVHIFDNHFPKLIKSMIMTNERLLEKYKSIKQNQDLFAKLEEKIRLIQKATESFEMIRDFD